jgi:hypothetical protein
MRLICVEICSSYVVIPHSTCTSPRWFLTRTTHRWRIIPNSHVKTFFNAMSSHGGVEGSPGNSRLYSRMHSTRTQNQIAMFVKNWHTFYQLARGTFRFGSLPLLLTQIWFQNRRQKAKLLKKTVEQRTREVLEEATKRTEAEQAQRVHTQTMESPVQLQSENTQGPSTPQAFHQRARSSNENTPNQQRLSASPYPSPQEASYASLARSIAVAAAAAAATNGPQSCPPTAGIPQLGHNPFFNSPMMNRSISTLSDCPTIDTPMSATPSYASTPFEYLGTGELVETPLPSNDPSNIGVAKQFPDFAAAVDAHNLKRPATLLHPRHAQLAIPEPTTKSGGRPALSRMNSCPADFVDAFGSVALGSPVVEKPLTLASVAEQATNKRRRPRLSPLGVGMARSRSSMGVCQSANAPSFQTDSLRFSPTLNRTIHSTPSSPVEVSPLDASQFIKESPQKHINTSLSVEGPLTPISPVGKQNPVDISPTLSLARAAGLTQLKRPQVALNTEDIFSPPTTPAHSLKMQRGLSFSTDGFSDVFLGSFDHHLSSSPTQFRIPNGMSDYSNNMDDGFPSSLNMSDQEIDFSNYLEL